MIKWEHSVFALPFALCGAMLAANGLPTAHQLTWIVVAMVAARSAAMAFNRLADASLDAANPRTQTRALPAATLTPGFVATFVVVSGALFVLAASQLNRLTFALSPVALAVVLLYSYTKRVTRWSHLVLGFALGIAHRNPGSGGRIIRSPHSAADRRSHLLGGRFRRALQLPGLRIRPAGRAALHPALLWYQQGTLDLPSLPSADAAPACQSGNCVRAGKTGDRRCRAGRLAAFLRALSRLAHRPLPTQRRVLHHERRHLGGVLCFRGRRSAAAEVRGASCSGEPACGGYLHRSLVRASWTEMPMPLSSCSRLWLGRGTGIESSLTHHCDFATFLGYHQSDVRHAPISDPPVPDPRIPDRRSPPAPDLRPSACPRAPKRQRRPHSLPRRRHSGRGLAGQSCARTLARRQDLLQRQSPHQSDQCLRRRMPPLRLRPQKGHARRLHHGAGRGISDGRFRLYRSRH